MRKTKIEIYNNNIFKTLPKRCVLNAGKCSLISDKNNRKKLIEKQPFAFIMRPYSNDCLDMEEACKKLIKEYYYIVRNTENTIENTPTNEIGTVIAKEGNSIGHGFCQICSLCLYSFFGVAELAKLNPNVFLEIGLMLALSKPVIFTLDTRLTTLEKIPSDLRGILVVPYENNKELLEGLQSKLIAVKDELKRKELI